MANNSRNSNNGPIEDISPDKAFTFIKKCHENGRRIVPLFGAGISVGAGIPTSNFLADYICAVCAVAKSDGWENNYRNYLRKFGWPHRHDTWLRWLLAQSRKTDPQQRSKCIYNGEIIRDLNAKFESDREMLYRSTVMEEIRKIAPLYRKMGDKHFNGLKPSMSSYTDYRSLLLTIADGDSSFVDSFFDHFIRDREPTMAHQFIAFLTKLLDWRLILTTNFDSLIERAMRMEGHQPTVYEIAKDSTMPGANLVRQQEIAVVKLHGGTHLLRTGYDLDEGLPAATLMEIRNYLKPQGSKCVPPLLLVLGYSGSDRRVMDIVADHLSNFRKDEMTTNGCNMVLWVSRDGKAPDLLKLAAQVVANETTSATSLSKGYPAAVCMYRDARLFLQELYQVIDGQHAVSQSRYRVVVQVPPPLEMDQDKSTEEKDPPPETRPVIVFWRKKNQWGTSTALLKAAHALEKTHEIIWIDAADFTTRAGLISAIMDEFARLDRGHVPASRTFMVEDVDFLRSGALNKVTRANNSNNGQNSPSNSANDDNAIERNVAIKWICHTMRRGNFVLAIDSLGEFGSVHPSIPERYRGNREQQRKETFTFLGELFDQAKHFGRSHVMVAVTPMADGSEIADEAALKEVFACRPSSESNKWQQQVPEYTGATGGNGYLNRARKSCDSVRVLLNTSTSTKDNVQLASEIPESDKKLAAGLLIAIASLFRRPRSRTALLVAFARYLRIARDSKVPQSIKTLARRYAKDHTKLMELGNKALNNIGNYKTGKISGKKWDILSRLEGGFYWMHLEGRDQIYDMVTRNGVDATYLFSPKILAELFHEIAIYMFVDVYKRSHDVGAFVEYLHYELMAITVSLGGISNDDKEIEILKGIANHLEAFYPYLLVSGKLVELIGQITPILTFCLSRVLNIATNNGNGDFREYTQRIIGIYAQLLNASGHPRDAARYEVLRWHVATKQDITIDNRIMTKAELLQSLSTCTPKDILDTINKAIENKSVSNGDKTQLKIVSELARYTVDPLLFFTSFDENEIGRSDAPRWKAFPFSKPLRSFLEKRFQPERCNLADRLYELCKPPNGGTSEKGANKAPSAEDIALEARLEMFHQRDLLYRAVWPYRFEWLLDDVPVNCTVPNGTDLSKIAKGCTEMLERLQPQGRLDAATRSIVGLLHAIRGYALYAVGGMKGGNDPRVLVSFRRAQAAMNRAASPNEQLASAIILMMEAECHVLGCMPDITVQKEGSKFANTKRLNQAEILLRQAEKLLRGARWQNRYQVQYLLQHATLEYARYEMAVGTNEKKQRLRAALRSNIAALTSMGFQTDWRIYGEMLHARIRKEFLGMDAKGQTLKSLWKAELFLCGIP